jgi:hypothetical protein
VNKYTKTFLSLLAVMVMQDSLKASIIEVTGSSNANGEFVTVSAKGYIGDTELIRYAEPEISTEFGNKSLGSAGSFDSILKLEGDEILFKNGNAAFGIGSSSSSRTVVNIKFQNTGSEAVIPILESQILPAGMGLFISDCKADNLRECQSLVDTAFGFDDILPPERSYSTEHTLMSATFDFKVVLEGFAEPLFSMDGSLSLTRNSFGEISIVEDLADAESRLNDFRQTSPYKSKQQLTYDWGATNFSVKFPEEIDVGFVSTVSYIIDVNTTTSSYCLSAAGCPIAYAAFGDPIGRGGAGTTRPSNPKSASFSSKSFLSAALATDTQIKGYETGLFRMATPTFKNGTLSYLAISGPGIATVAVPASTSFAFFALGVAFLTLRRQRSLQ